MPEATYIICAITSLASAILLMRPPQGARHRLLFWGAVFFLGMALNNVVLFMDSVVVPHLDWSLAPNLVMFASVAALIYGLVWEVN